MKNKLSSARAASAPAFRMLKISLVIGSLFGTVSAVQAQQVAYREGAGPAPLVERNANGPSRIDIVNPDKNGLSHNRYETFNVDKNGVILNNSVGRSDTNLGGNIAGNQQLEQEARIILNEVVSTNRSYLSGDIEVAGQRADVIIANPNGISVGGTNFINAGDVTLTTGTPVTGENGLSGFRVTRGDIAISGPLNGKPASTVNLLARSVALNSMVLANNLNVVTGANEIGYGQDLTADGVIKVIKGEGDVPTVALDASALGGMYANQIHLIGTEKGVGVVSHADITADAGSVIIDSAGRVSLKGNLLASRDLTISSGEEVDIKSRIPGQSIKTVQAAGNVAIAAEKLNLDDAVIQSRDASVTLVAGKGGLSHRKGSTTARTKLDVITDENIDNRDGNFRAANAQLVAKNFDNQNGRVLVNQDLSLVSNEELNNTSGDISAEGELNLIGDSLVNQRGRIQGGQTTVGYAGNITNQFGQINGNVELNLVAGVLNNQRGAIWQQGGRNIAGVTPALNIKTAGDLDNTGGRIQASDKFRGIVGGTLTNTGWQSTGGNTSGGEIFAGGIGINADQSIDNRSGQIRSTRGKLALTAPVIRNNDGIIQHRGGEKAVVNVAVQFDNKDGRFTASEGAQIIFKAVPAEVAVVEPIVTPAPVAVAEPDVTPAPVAVVEPVVTPAPVAVVEPVVTPAPVAVVAPVVKPVPLSWQAQQEQKRLQREKEVQAIVQAQLKRDALARQEFLAREEQKAKAIRERAERDAKAKLALQEAVKQWEQKRNENRDRLIAEKNPQPHLQPEIQAAIQQWEKARNENRERLIAEQEAQRQEWSNRPVLQPGLQGPDYGIYGNSWTNYKIDQSGKIIAVR